MLSQMTTNMIAKFAKESDEDELAIDIFNHLNGWSNNDLIELCDDLSVSVNAHNYYLFDDGTEYSITDLIKTCAVRATAHEVFKLKHSPKQGA